MVLTLEILKVIIFVPIFVYFVYPMYLLILVKIQRTSKINKANTTINHSQVSVDLIMTMHNAENLVVSKVENIKRLEFSGKLTHCFILDGCTDNTEAFLKSALKDNQVENYIIHECKERIGKEEAIKSFLPRSSSEILVFSDADAKLEVTAINHLIDKLLEDGIGAVSGREIHSFSEHGTAGQGQSLFYFYEEFIKEKLEYLNRSLTYVQGGVFAMKKKHYPHDIPIGATQDGIIAFSCIQNGERVAYCPNAVSFEEYNIRAHSDFSRRRRTVSRAFYAILSNIKILNPIKYPTVSMDLLFGRLLRWLSPYFVILGLTFILIDPQKKEIWDYTLAATGIFFSLAALGALLERTAKRIKYIYIFYYFTYIHIAAALAIFDVVKGKRQVTWKPTGQ